MEIRGEITGIKYRVLLSENMKIIDMNHFNINKNPAYCLVKDDDNSFAVSRWISPKRTRSYPYERIYNTLSVSKRIAVIPIIKDEGTDGDRDFLQWDTVSLMSLLDVFVIFAYYNKAVKNFDYDNKITDFQFHNRYIVSKIKETERYHSSALHWNLNELRNNFHNVLDKAKRSYAKIGKQTGVALHDQAGIDRFKAKIGKDVENFMRFSREKSERAQAREIVTAQPKENLSTLTKAKITITNYLGGQYFFTADEILVDKDTVRLIESKHSKSSILPNASDIKDGLLKMILYSNLVNVTADGMKMKSRAVLRLTSEKLKGEITSEISDRDRSAFLSDNPFSREQIKLIDTLLDEAAENNFSVQICNSKIQNKQ